MIILRLAALIIFAAVVQVFPQKSLLMEISPIAVDENKNIDPIFTLLLLSYNILNINDVFLTRNILDKGGYEANPLMSWSAKNRPYELIFKSALMLGENYTLKWLKEENDFLAYTAAILLNILYSYVNYNNYQVVFRLSRS